MGRFVICASSLVILTAALHGFAGSEGSDGILDDEGRISGSAPSLSERAAEKRQRDREVEEMLKGRFVDRVSVDMVMIPAVVEDWRGRPVVGLKASDFRLLEDGQPQRIEYFFLDQDQPISVAFLLDVSGSMRMSGKIETAKEAARYFLNSLRPKDEVALVAFADRQVAMLTDFDSDHTETLKYLRAVKAYGQTALNDAVAATPEMVNQHHKGRKAIILLTDGVDNYSEMSLSQAMRAARMVGVPIYTIGFATQRRAVDGRTPPETPVTRALRQVAVETGGQFFLIYDPDDMKEAVSQIEEDLRTQYVLGYSPAAAKADGRFRKISLVAREGRYTVRTRKGYVLNP